LSSQTSFDVGEEAEEEEDVKDPRFAYFDSILLRYETLRAQLLQTPPREAVEKLDKDHPTYLGRLNTEVARWWRWKMREVDPVPAQVACMDKNTVLRLLGLLTTGTLLKRGAEVQMGVSRWAWSLLSRLPERGELTSEEIGVVRELGKKAVLVGTGLREEHQWEEGMDEVEAGFEEEEYDEGIGLRDDQQWNEDMDEVEAEVEDRLEAENQEANLSNEPDEALRIGPQLSTDDKAVEYVNDKQPSDDEKTSMPEGKDVENEHEESLSEDLAAAKARILAALDNSAKQEAIQEAQVLEEEAVIKLRKREAKWNTKATVDMIITVAGEMYGQRDLLEFRQTWGDIGW
jgi:hypothetical protein